MDAELFPENVRVFNPAIPVARTIASVLEPSNINSSMLVEAAAAIPEP
jgi:hypothetical protein